MRAVLKNSHICEECKNLKKQRREMKFGTWEYVCSKYNIGRGIESDSCDNYK